ncbi:MAG: hypothetical protein P4M07_18905 [Xanthobacteraceae bacterium]|nr:hypothetical protein [Xanthobacteraceae bacterium]
MPVPDTASDITFDGASGRLEFNSSSSVKSLAAFYRAATPPLGWKEEPSVINGPTMTVPEFSRKRPQISFTVMQLGAKVKSLVLGADATWGLMIGPGDAGVLALQVY